MWRESCPFLVIAFLLSFVSGMVAAPSRLSITGSPNPSQGTFRLLVRIPHHPDNRRLSVNWDMENGPAGSESVQLDDQAAEAFEFHYRYQAGWHYIFVVTLTDNRGKNVSVQTLEVGE